MCGAGASVCGRLQIATESGTDRTTTGAVATAALTESSVSGNCSQAIPFRAITSGFVASSQSIPNTFTVSAERNADSFSTGGAFEFFDAASVNREIFEPICDTNTARRLPFNS